MRILHTSDWHLGIEFHRRSLIEDQRYMIQSLKTILAQEQVDVVVISGDIFDTPQPSQKAIELFDEAMYMLCRECQVQVVLISGNHDSAIRLRVHRELLASQGLHIFSNLQESCHPVTIQDVDFYGIPFVHKRSFERFYDRRFKDLDEGMQHHIQNIYVDNGRCSVALAHCFVRGSQKSDSERFQEVGGSESIFADTFACFTYSALGHLHHPQNCSDTVSYSGSLLPYAFSEDHGKSVVIFDSETLKQKRCPLVPLHPIITLQGTLEPIADELLAHRNDYIKVVLQKQMVSFEILAYLKERAPYILSLQGEHHTDVQEQVSLNLEQLETMQDEDIVKQFFQDYYHRELDEEELSWFYDAAKECETCESNR